jgi:hypothetical protein
VATVADHPGWPATPGIARAVTILDSGLEAEERRREVEAATRRHDLVNAVIGEATRRMTPERRASLAESFPELSPAISLLR